MFKRFLKNKSGTVAIIGAVAIPILIGVAALVAEFGHGLLTKAEDQRIADVSAYAGALAYNSTNSTTSMQNAAKALAALNGVASTGVTASLVTSPSGDGNQSVSVQINTKNLMFLAPVLGSGTQLPVSSSSYVEMAAQAQGCLIALSTRGTGVTLSGGTALNAPSCAVASNTTVSVPCGTTVTTKAVDYNSTTVPSQPCSGIKPPTGTTSVIFAKTVTADPLATNTGVTGGSGRLATVKTMTSPSSPAVTSTTAFTGGYVTSSPPPAGIPAGCSLSMANYSAVETITCPAGKTYNFGPINFANGNTSFTLAVSGTSGNPTTFNIAYIYIGGGQTATFAGANYNIAQGIFTGGGSKTSFGAGGVINIGMATNSSLNCNGAYYSICNTGTSLGFVGPSTFILGGGIYNGGGETLVMGGGSTNSFQIGPSSNGNAFYMGGGAITTFGDALGSSSVFQMNGNFNVASGGGSCVAISAAANHDINGYFAGAGGILLGSGVYTVNGYIGLGANGGGNVTCFGNSIGILGNGVTLITNGVSTPSSGTCSGQAFCVAAGYSSVTLTAPTTGSTANLVVVGPTSSTVTTGATFAEGASGASLSGAFYFPYGPITLSGGASVGNGSGQCLEIIGSQVTLSGGTALASQCISTTSASAAVTLVQ